MSEEPKGKLKHRHDGPDPDHGAETQHRIMRGIQFILAVGLILTAALLLFSGLSA